MPQVGFEPTIPLLGRKETQPSTKTNLRSMHHVVCHVQDIHRYPTTQTQTTPLRHNITARSHYTEHQNNRELRNSKCKQPTGAVYIVMKLKPHIAIERSDQSFKKKNSMHKHPQT
jgi:hypothetical protein